MKLYYRISDNGYKKPKLIGATKEACLMNFVSVFREQVFGGTKMPDEDFVSPLHVICDRCNRTTVKMIADSGLPYTLTDRGNAGSFRAALEMAIDLQDELVYFVEDDYLHLPIAPKLLEEISTKSDYATLYDHPDKYTSMYDNGEVSKVIRTESSHWRFTVSTCMTFATTSTILKADADIWFKHTDDNHPWDHKIFLELKDKGRKLAVPIPGAACHTDLTFSGKANKVLIEHWAIDMMIDKLQSELSADVLNKTWLKDKQGWERLVALDALSKFG